MTVHPKVGSREADAIGRKAFAPVGADKVSSTRQAIAGKKEASPTTEIGSLRPGDPNRKNRAQALQPI
jgi:hypothetical protein